MYRTLVLIGVACSIFLYSVQSQAGQGQIAGDEPADAKRLKEKLELLEVRLELLKKENELLKKENELLKKEMELLKTGKAGAKQPAAAAPRTKINDIEYEFGGAARNGNLLQITVYATSKKGNQYAPVAA